MAPVIEDARRRQRRRRRIGTFGAVGLAVIAAAVFGSRQLGAPSHATVSTNARPTAAPRSTSFTYETEQTASGLAIRRVMTTTAGQRRYGPDTVTSSAVLRRSRHGHLMTVEVVPSPGTDAVGFRVVDNTMSAATK